MIKEDAINYIVDEAIENECDKKEIKDIVDNYNRETDSDIDYDIVISKVNEVRKSLDNEELNQLVKDSLQLKNQIDTFEGLRDATNLKIKILMKEQKLNFYSTPRGDSISYKTHTRESLDKQRVKELLGELQFKEVVSTTSFETLKILSKESRDKIQKNIKGETKWSN